MDCRRSGLPRRIAITLALGATLPLSAPVLAHAQLGDETLHKGTPAPTSSSSSVS